MSRAAADTDVFQAIAEPHRRQIVMLLAAGEPRSVGELVDALQIAQPSVSKHLAILRSVGVVTVQQQGKSRLYALNPTELKPVYDWIKPLERFWAGQLDRIRQRAERKAQERSQRN